MLKGLKRILAIALCGAMAIGLSACGNDDANTGSSDDSGAGKKETVHLLVWGAQEDQMMLGEMAEAFELANPDKNYKFEFGVVGEPDVKNNLSSDIETAADVFSFPSDQLRDMVLSGLLYEVGGQFGDAAKASNTPASVAQAMYDDKVYGFPSTADNTYFLFYNNEYFGPEDVQSMDSVLSKVNDKHTFFMDISNGFYDAAFFFTAGGTMSVSDDGKQILTGWDTEAAIDAACVANDIARNPGFKTGDDAIFTAGFEDESIICGVSGIWNANAVKKALGDKVSFAKLPTIKIGGEDKQMISFGGCKIIGVNRTTKNPGEAMKFAQFITNKENQIKRFETRGFAPANTEASKDPRVLADPALKAVIEQMQHSYSQTNAISSFWTPAEALGAEMEKGALKTREEVEAEVRHMIESMG